MNEEEDVLNDKDCVQLLKSVLSERGVEHHHIESYNFEIENNLNNLYYVRIDPIPLSDGTVMHIRFGKTYFRPPVIVEDTKRIVKLTPALARARGENYCAPM